MKESTAEVTLNGTGANLDGSRFVELRITDSTSGRLVCEASFTGEEIVAMLAGRYLSKVPIKWYAPDRIGWKAEHMKIPVTYSDAFSNREKNARKAVDTKIAALERAHPGCAVSAHYDDATNGHRRTSLSKDPEGDQEKRLATYLVHFTVLHPPTDEEA